VHDRDRPLGGLARGEEIEDLLPAHRIPVLCEQAQPRPAGPHDEIGAAVQDAPQRRRAGVAAVAHCDVTRSELSTTDPLRAAPVSQFESAEAAGRRVVDRVQAPVRPLAARPSDDAAVGDAEPPARQRSGGAPRCGRGAAHERPRDLAQPGSRVAHALHHRRIRQVGEAADPGPGRRLPQG
jgi:hypothetical protein